MNPIFTTHMGQSVPMLTIDLEEAISMSRQQVETVTAAIAGVDEQGKLIDIAVAGAGQATEGILIQLTPMDVGTQILISAVVANLNLTTMFCSVMRRVLDYNRSQYEAALRYHTGHLSALEKLKAEIEKNIETQQSSMPVQ